MRLCIRSFVVGIILCSWSKASSETILFKSGETVKGAITDRTEESLVIETAGIPLTFFLDEIDSIDGARLQDAPRTTGAAVNHRPFSLYIPAGWHEQEGAEGTDRRFVFSKEPLAMLDEPPRIGMTVVWNTNRLVFVDWETMQNSQKEFWAARDISIIREGPDIIDQRPAYVSIVHNGSRTMMSVLINHRQDLISIVCQTPKADWDEYEPVFRKMLSSFSSGKEDAPGENTDITAHAQAQEWFNKGLERITHGRFKEAVDFLEHSRQLQPESAEVYAALGTAYVNLGKTREAFDVLQHALRLQPDMPAALLMVGSLYVEQRDFDQAKIYLGKARQAFQRLGDSSTAQIAEDMLKNIP